MASYSVIASQSTIQVWTPTTVTDAVEVTISSQPSGITAGVVVPQETFDANGGVYLLQTVSDNIDFVVNSGKVSGGLSGQIIDPNGMLLSVVDFTVSYTPPGSQTGPLTAQAEVPVYLLEADNPDVSVMPLIDKVYNNLVAMASGTPPPAPPPVEGGTGTGGTATG